MITTKTVRKGIATFFMYFILIFLAVMCFIPFYIMIINATHSNVEISQSIWLTLGSSLSDNYQIIMSKVNIWRGFFNSILITFPSVFLSAYFGTLTAYGFAKFHFKGKEIFYWFILVTMMIPQQLGLIGYVELNAKLGLLDTYWPLILPSIANAGFVFFVRGFISSSIHDSLIEAALMDGAKESYIFHKIVIPLSMPAIATMSIFNFVAVWNNYLNPLILISSQEKFPLPVVISMIRGLYETNFGAIYLGIAISIVPIMIAFIFLSNKIIDGLTIGGVKG